MSQKIKVGDRQQIVTENYSGEGTVTDITKIDSKSQKGLLVTYRLERYGQANAFFYPEQSILETQFEGRRNRSGMPKEHVYKFAKDFNWSLYGEDVEAQKKLVNAFVINFNQFRKQGRGLYIYSKEKGSGKTMLSCCILNEILKKHDIPVKFISMPEYIELVKSKTETAKEQVEQILECVLLVIDDIGTTVNNQEWIANTIFRLVNRRHENLLPTIYTSNMDIEDLKCDERVISRIYEDTLPIIMPEVSIRRKNADKHKKEFLRNVLLEEDKSDIENVFT